MIVEIIMYTFLILIAFTFFLGSLYGEYKLPRRRWQKILTKAIMFVGIIWLIFHLVRNHDKISSPSWIMIGFPLLLAVTSIIRTIIVKIGQQRREKNENKG